MKSATARAQEAVLRFEQGRLSLGLLLTSCTEREIFDIIGIEDPVEFVDRVYGVVRRVESAAWMKQGKKSPLVVIASRRVYELGIHIKNMQMRVEQYAPKTPLENAGTAFLIDRLR